LKTQLADGLLVTKLDHTYLLVRSKEKTKADDARTPLGHISTPTRYEAVGEGPD